MELEEFKRQLHELRDIIIEGIAYFSAWYGIANLDEDSADALNRYRAFFLPAQPALKKMALLQFAKVFDNDTRTVSLHTLLSAAKSNPALLVPYAEGDDLENLERKIDSNEQLLSHLKSYRDQRLAHHDQVVSRDTSLPFGQVRQLIDDVKDMYNSLSNWHERSTISLDFMYKEAERHTSDVIRIMCEERDRAKQQTSEADNQIDKLDSLRKEIVFGTNIAVFALAFAIIVYAISIFFKNILQGSVGIVLSFMMLMLGFPNNRKWIAENYKRFRWLFYLIIGILIIVAILSIHFVWVIPI
jgi:hypothetical protein